MKTFPQATIPNTEVRTLRSSIVDQEYLISVALPSEYSDFPEKTYPVIYMLDANTLFGMVTQILRNMNWRVPFCSQLPDAIIVGIGYPESGPKATTLAQRMNLRQRDFHPVVDEENEKFLQELFPLTNPVAMGKADQFLQFIRDELMPFVESEYRIDTTDRALISDSSGGVFALYALFHQPELFQRYIVVSPSIPYGNGVTLDYERTYAEHHNDLKARVYLAFGEPELNDWQLPYLNPFLKALEGRKYPGFTLIQQTIANCDHCAVIAPALQAGLAAIYS